MEELRTDKEEAWHAVWAELKLHVPTMTNLAPTGRECAIAAIRQLAGQDRVGGETFAYAVQNDQGYWVGIWNNLDIATLIADKGLHGERVVTLTVYQGLVAKVDPKTDLERSARVCERGDAVNLAREVPALVENDRVTRHGIRILADAVLRMDEYIRALPSPQAGWVRVEERLPEPRLCVLVHGGAAYWTGAQWMTMMCCPHREIQWKVTHWMPLPSPPAPEPTREVAAGQNTEKATAQEANCATGDANSRAQSQPEIPASVVPPLPEEPQRWTPWGYTPGKVSVVAAIDYDALRQHATRLREELAETNRLIKNLAPTGRYNGLDIEQWYQRAEAAERTVEKMREVVETAKYANWVPDAGGYREGRAIEDCYERLHYSLCEYLGIDDEAIPTPNSVWMTEDELDAAIDAARAKEGT